MPVVKRIKIQRDSEDRENSITVNLVINVNSDGEFTTTIPEEEVLIIEGYGVDLSQHRNRQRRKGYFESNTMDSLIVKISNVLKECLSRELINEEIVIRYAISSVASFGFTEDNQIIPNLGWTDDGPPDTDRHWQKGTIDTHAAKQRPVGIQYYVNAALKRTYKYAGGRIAFEYKNTSAFGQSKFPDKLYYLRWLEGICSTSIPDEAELREIPYTEEKAKFFVTLFKTICQMAHKIALIEEPDQMELIIQNPSNFKMLS